MKSLWLLSAFLLTTATTGAVWLFNLKKEKVAEIHPAVLAVITDLVVTAGIGGAATLIFHILKLRQEIREADRRVRCETLREVLAAYNEVKEVRRLMRAEAIRPRHDAPHAVVLSQPYTDLMRKFNLAHLKLETQKRLIRSSAERYHRPEDLIKALDCAEGYLGSIVGEWENKLGTVQNSPGQISLGSLPALEAFVDEADKSFRPHVVDHIKEVFKHLGEHVR